MKSAIGALPLANFAKTLGLSLLHTSSHSKMGSISSFTPMPIFLFCSKLAVWVQQQGMVPSRQIRSTNCHTILCLPVGRRHSVSFTLVQQPLGHYGSKDSLAQLGVSNNMYRLRLGFGFHRLLLLWKVTAVSYTSNSTTALDLRAELF